MKKIFLLIIALAIVIPSVIAIAASDVNETLTLVVGQQKIYSGKNIKSVSIGDKKVASVITSKDQSKIVVKARAKGQTHLVMFKKSGEKITVAIIVLAIDPKKVKGEIEDALKGIEGITIRTLGDDKVLIDGQVFTEKDLTRCKKVAGWYGDMVKLLVEFNDAYIPMKKNIDVEFNLIEINKKALGNIGINWDDMLAIGATATLGAPIPTGGFTGKVGITTNFGNALNIMVGDGSAKLLKKHNVVVQSGIEAEWFAGGTFYVKNITQNTSTVEPIDYGTRIIVTPKIDRLNNMLIICQAEISEMDPSNVVDGIPALTKRKLRSQVTMKEGDTLLLSGVIDRISGNDVQRVPFLGKIPILGWLFKSKSYQTGVTDAVFFVTPKVIAAASESSNKRIKNMMSSYDKAK